MPTPYPTHPPVGYPQPHYPAVPKPQYKEPVPVHANPYYPAVPEPYPGRQDPFPTKPKGPTPEPTRHPTKSPTVRNVNMYTNTMEVFGSMQSGRHAYA